MNNLIRIIVISLFIPQAYAMKMDESFPIAKVVKVKGDVSILPPHSMEARPLKLGEMLLKDSSILSKKGSFAKVKFINKSTMIIGPNSKTIIEMDLEDRTSLINVISGKVRAKVEKEKESKKEKMLVKTRTAVMGIRGTEFQVSFESESQRTSLLTYDGIVDIAKPDNKNLETKNTKTKISEIKKSLKKNLKTVKKGDFTNITKDAKEPLKPVKISAVQYSLLKRDESLGAVKKVLTKKEKIEVQKEVQVLKKEFGEIAQKRKSEQEIRELGLMDPDTGLYVPPTDENMQRLLGKVNDNGAYIPPRGIKVDKKKGLVITEEASDEIKESFEKVEEVIQKQVKNADENDPSYRRYFQE